MKQTISWLDRITQVTDLRPIKVESIFEHIRKGTLIVESTHQINLKEAIEYINSHPTQKSEAKLNLLPATLYSGTFFEKRITHLDSYSNLIAMDFDNLPNLAETNRLRAYLMQFPYILAIYRTPSGLGLKAVIKHTNTNPIAHESLFNQVAMSLNVYYLDRSCKDLARAHYLSYDPEIYVNPNCIPYQYKSEVLKPNAVRTASNIIVNQGMDKKILTRLNTKWEKDNLFDGTNRKTRVFTISCQCNRSGLPVDFVRDYLYSKFIPLGLDKSFIDMKLREVYKRYNTEFGTTRNSWRI